MKKNLLSAIWTIVVRAIVVGSILFLLGVLLFSISAKMADQEKCNITEQWMQDVHIETIDGERIYQDSLRIRGEMVAAVSRIHNFEISELEARFPEEISYYIPQPLPHLPCTSITPALYYAVGRYTLNVGEEYFYAANTNSNILNALLIISELEKITPKEYDDWIWASILVSGEENAESKKQFEDARYGK